MPKIISGGKVSAVVFDSIAEIETSFYIAPPFDGEVLLPFIPVGIICDLTVLKDNVAISETRAINIREFNAAPESDFIIVSRRIDGCVVLKFLDIEEESSFEVRVKAVVNLEDMKGYRRLVFPAGYGEKVMTELYVRILSDVIKVTSPTHKIHTRLSDKETKVEAEADINGESFVLDIYGDEENKAKQMISRRILEDNLSLCIFIPKIGDAETVYVAQIEPIGGLNVKLLESRIEYKHGESCRCFATHSIIPPNGIKIKLENEKETEEIYFQKRSTELFFYPLELMYAEERIKLLRERAEDLPYEERCAVREEINDICRRYKIAMGDIALACVSKGKKSGLICGNAVWEEDIGSEFNEKTKISIDYVIERILNSQSMDGVIADMAVYKEEALIHSTAICLIALYLYTGDKYSEFAKRSLKLIGKKSGFWVDTAVKLWNGEDVDLNELKMKADMKIMYRRLDELAVEIIKISGGDKNDSNRM
ncbi:MAG: hypothetical protein E7415_06805 [Ruminococcaceae bacterium]|nr:hypothetical protein [Oscillospiraceae bacterium]